MIDKLNAVTVAALKTIPRPKQTRVTKPTLETKSYINKIIKLQPLFIPMLLCNRFLPSSIEAKAKTRSLGRENSKLTLSLLFE